MAIGTTQVTVSSAAVMVLGAGSTVLNTAGVTNQRPITVSILNMASTRVFISPTSAGTTANGYVVVGLGQFAHEHRHQDTWWMFTSAGAASRVLFMGGLQ